MTKEITIQIDGDKTDRSMVNIVATGNTFPHRDEFKTRGFTWTGSEWTKSAAASSGKSDADWFKTFTDCRIFVGGRKIHQA